MCYGALKNIESEQQASCDLKKKFDSRHILAESTSNIKIPFIQSKKVLHCTRRALKNAVALPRLATLHQNCANQSEKRCSLSHRECSRRSKCNTIGSQISRFLSNQAARLVLNPRHTLERWFDAWYRSRSLLAWSPGHRNQWRWYPAGLWDRAPLQ